MTGSFRKKHQLVLKPGFAQNESLQRDKNFMGDMIPIVLRILQEKTRASAIDASESMQAHDIAADK
jgi:hypothetical protein